MDARAVKNEQLFKALDAQIKKESKRVTKNKDALRQEHTDLIEKLGPCPMTCNDVLESLMDGDCFGVCLDIGRSEATIMDPTKLVIKKIVPTFMGIDAFMESSIFNLKKNQDASGGFDYTNEASLAIGMGRENVSGILPLFLFKEHWQVAKRKMQSVLGFMCTLDPMGYASSQYFNIPFMVQNVAFKQLAVEDSEMNRMVLNMVIETCQNMM